MPRARVRTRSIIALVAALGTVTALVVAPGARPAGAAPVGQPPTRTGGTVLAWGANSTAPPSMLDGQTVAALAAGGNHTLALTGAGKVVAWGADPDGETDVPAALDAQRSVAVAAGLHHSLALTEGGQVVAWGDDSLDQTDVPAPVSNATITAIAAGDNFSLALSDAGRVYAWGDPTGGVLSVPGLANAAVTSIAAGDEHALALDTDGQVIAWGDDSSGQTDVPASLGSTQVTAIAAGRQASLALTATGHAVPWGSDVFGQDEVDSSLEFATVTAIAVGDGADFALTDAERIVGWGSDEGSVFEQPAELATARATAVVASTQAVYAIVRSDPSFNGAPTGDSQQDEFTDLIGQYAPRENTTTSTCDDDSEVDTTYRARALIGLGLDYLPRYVGTGTQTEGGAGIELSCRPFVDDTPALAEGIAPALTRLDADAETQADGPTPTVLCPAGQVVTGVGANAAVDGAALSDLQPYCATLGDDGAPLDDAAAQPWIRHDDGVLSGVVQCPNGYFATGLWARTAAFVDAVQLQCSAPVFFGGVRQPDNSSWLTAQRLAPNDTVQQNLTSTEGTRWFKVPVQPSSQFGVDLTGLTVNDDLTVFSDIGQAFATAASTQDLTRISAEAAGTTFSPTTFSPTTFSPTTFSPTTFSPTTFSPTTFSPTTFSPTTFSPTTFSPTTFSPTTFSPTTFSPYVTPDLYTKIGAFSDLTDFEDAYSSAQSRSVLTTSANEGTAPESVTGNTENHTGFFYLRVTARNGVGSPARFTLSVSSTGGPCTVPLDDFSDAPTITGTPGVSTVVLTDSSRLTGTGSGAALTRANTAFAGSVDGGAAVVDVSASERVRDLNAQADANPGCPYAKNLVGAAIRDIVNSYRGAGGSLQYVVLEGDDAVIPYFRYADDAGVAAESGFAPPVATGTASRASLANNLVLGQDAYGSAIDLAIGGTAMPVPDLAVGRLVETPQQISTALLNYANGVTRDIPVSSTLATGYDFLTAGAREVAANFAAGNPDGTNDTLITNAGVPPGHTTVGGRPSPSTSWTATDLEQSLFGSRHDLLYLAGHFSASEALAADFSTRISTADVAAASPTPSTSSFLDSLVISPGCHSGYNVVDADGIADVTDTLDWAQEFATQGATLIAGTGYQYGDTDFVKYSNALYVALSKRLRTGDGPVSIGAALAQAKTDYLASQVGLSGVDRKSLLESALYGLPMQTLSLSPSGRVDPPTVPGPVDTTDEAADPGATLGLSHADVSLDPVLRPVTTSLTRGNGASVSASYNVGPDGVESDPAAPALPLIVQNATAPDGTVLRGVGFWSGSYHDRDGVTPLTGAPATESSTVHGPFVSSVFYPNTLATPNYSSALGGATGTGETRLLVTPTQYRSDHTGSLTDTERTYSNLGFRLFYSGNTTTYGDNVPALAAAPTMRGVTAVVNRRRGTVTYSAHVVGDPAAGIQEVWVTSTDPTADTPRWTSLDLVQDPSDSTLWTATVPLVGNGANLQFFVQAANGVGLVGVDNNAGHYYVPRAAPISTDASSLALSDGVRTRVATGKTLAVSAQLTSGGTASVQGRAVTFTLGGASVVGRTDAQGTAHAALPVTAAPGAYPLSAAFVGVGHLAGSSAGPVTITVTKWTPTLCMTADPDGNLHVQLTRALTCSPTAPGIPSHTVFVVGLSDRDAVEGVVPVLTGGDGTATVPLAALPAAASTATAYFGALSTPVPRHHNTLSQADPIYRAARSESLRVVPDHIVVTGPGTLAPGTPGAFTTAGYTADDVSRGDLTLFATLTITPLTGGSTTGARCTPGTCRASVAGTYRVLASYHGHVDATQVVVGSAGPGPHRVI